LKANENVEVVFFTKPESREKSIKSGYAWTSNLRYKFLGLDGTVAAEPISGGNLGIENGCHE
jgi:hypothetical protein